MCNRHHENSLSKSASTISEIILYERNFSISAFPFLFSLTPSHPDLYTEYFTEPSRYMWEQEKLLSVYVFFMKKKCWTRERASERGEGCAIDFLFSSRTNNILWLALAPNMKWKSTKLWNIYFSFLWPHLRSNEILFILRFLHVLFLLLYEMFTYGRRIWFQYRKIWRRRCFTTILKFCVPTDYHMEDLTLIYLN